MHAAAMADDVVAFSRPRTHGFFRTRAPIWLQIFRAAREDRLVWHGPDSFVVLRAPADRAIGRTARGLRWIDRQWSLVVAADQITALTQMVWRGLRSLARDAPRPLEVAAETLPFEQWSMALCHHVGADGAAALLDSVERRLVALAGDDVALACPARAISTVEMRDRVAVWADGLRGNIERPEVSVRLPRRRPVRAHRVMETGAFFFVYLLLVAVMLVSMASSVVQWERSASGTPMSYATALEWIWYRLAWQDPPGVHPVTFWSRSTGVMIGVFLPLTVLVGAGAIAHYRRYRSALRAEYLTMMDDALGRDRVLLVVATEVEREAVLARSRAEPIRDFSGGHPVYRLGVIGDVEVLLAQCGPGVTGPVSVAYSLPELIEFWSPRFVIMLGICFGLREQEQSLGDVIVGRRLQVVNLRVGDEETRDRGDAITAGHRLVERFAVAVPPLGVRIWQGTLLSWDVLVDFAPLRAALRDRYRDALGGEMEGAAVYAAAVRAGVEWIVVKGICDWGQDKIDTAQVLAATNAAAVVFDLIEARAFVRGQGAPRP
ncbi:hypothetical protein Ahu01nite_088530 [Winogradskya humida]|uniref:Nucleoside phosphorylase domain-containing protein n=1 Tax=Winogradskya humida TaxID=113566 RepID=A0ABQ4A4H7_9ACTN|nr:hypothetical protein Ahu01nite_088530 [Actinoplanes humidus]